MNFMHGGADFKFRAISCNASILEIIFISFLDLSIYEFIEGIGKPFVQ